MDMKRVLLPAVFALSLVSAVFASRKDEVTLLLVPRDEQAVRVGRDVARSFPVLLLSYRVAPGGGLSLHGWNGKEWLNVTLSDYRDGRFFRTGPETALIIGKEGASLPELLIPPESWCGTVYKIGTTELRPMLHLIGRHFDFSYKEWKGFAANYGFAVDDINPEGLNIAWYNRRLSDQFKSRGNVGSGDLRYLAALRLPAPPAEPVEEAVKPAPAEEEPAVEEKAVEQTDEQPEMEQPEDPDVNPLAQEAPVAVVLGAGTADEEAAEADGNRVEEQ